MPLIAGKILEGITGGQVNSQMLQLQQALSELAFNRQREDEATAFGRDQQLIELQNRLAQERDATQNQLLQGREVAGRKQDRASFIERLEIELGLKPGGDVRGTIAEGRALDEKDRATDRSAQTRRDRLDEERFKQEGERLRVQTEREQFDLEQQEFNAFASIIGAVPPDMIDQALIRMGAVDANGQPDISGLSPDEQTAVFLGRAGVLQDPSETISAGDQLEQLTDASAQMWEEALRDVAGGRSINDVLVDEEVSLAVAERYNEIANLQLGRLLNLGYDPNAISVTFGGVDEVVATLDDFQRFAARQQAGLPPELPQGPDDLSDILGGGFSGALRAQEPAETTADIPATQQTIDAGRARLATIENAIAGGATVEEAFTEAITTANSPQARTRLERAGIDPHFLNVFLREEFKRALDAQFSLGATERLQTSSAPALNISGAGIGRR